jgi:CubicO group peptidase (beta-lactamase class C family)
MRWPGFLLALLAGLATLSASADVGAVAARLAGDPSVPGAAVGWVTAGDSALSVAGRRVEGDGPQVATGDLWHIGSLTKSMTAVLAARLVEAGVIGWDSTLGEVLGDRHPDMATAWRDVTLEELLRHASGMRANEPLVSRLWPGEVSRAEYVAQMLAGAPAGPRGGYLYSNAGYVVAGAMLEAAGGAPWEVLIERGVFGPLGMTSAGFGPPLGDQPQGHRPTLLRGLVPVPPGPGADNIAALGPAGRVHLSAGDMLIYLRAHLVRDPDLLTEDSWARLHRAEGPGDYALGWVAQDGMLRHSGSNTLWFAQMRLYPDDGIAVFVAVNSGAIDRVRGPVEAAAESTLSEARASVAD